MAPSPGHKRFMEHLWLREGSSSSFPQEPAFQSGTGCGLRGREQGPHGEVRAQGTQTAQGSAVCVGHAGPAGVAHRGILSPGGRPGTFWQLSLWSGDRKCPACAGLGHLLDRFLVSSAAATRLEVSLWGCVSPRQGRWEPRGPLLPEGASVALVLVSAGLGSDLCEW